MFLHVNMQRLNSARISRTYTSLGGGFEHYFVLKFHNLFYRYLFIQPSIVAKESHFLVSIIRTLNVFPNCRILHVDDKLEIFVF